MWVATPRASLKASVIQSEVDSSCGAIVDINKVKSITITVANSLQLKFAGSCSNERQQTKRARRQQLNARGRQRFFVFVPRYTVSVLLGARKPRGDGQ